MSTNSRIAVKTEEGYKTIYCHFDGYISYMFPMLTNNYGTEEKALELVNLGDASSIQEKLDSDTGNHSFENQEPGVCVFYHRDRDESWEDTAPAIYSTLEEVINLDYYVYVFENGCWSAYVSAKKWEGDI